MSLELLSHKRIKHRTDTTIQKCYVPGDIEGKVQTLRFTTHDIILSGAGNLYSLEENDDIVGCPANEESENDNKYEFDGTALLLHADRQDTDSDADVAVHHHEQREKEKQEELLVITDQTPALQCAFRKS